jgi:heme-degrading monooxygenase HmoA
MVLEVASLSVRAGQGTAFEQAFAAAQAIISSMDGYISHRLERSVEAPDKYLLLVEWRRVEDHTVGFRQSAGYQEWRRLLHHFYDPSPVIEHFEPVSGASPRGERPAEVS